ncbi:Uncharacterized protein OBRU01_13149 [Operophtera brumata]|uniref:Nuclease HARBI1 n=1 Tax=Operophtera brumata TaxID=104452 RepID=A0A0L7KTM5_OPEBR|nr:Uncharacterized protein OBRU01_13149 [Operophtera brumata]
MHRRKLDNVGETMTDMQKPEESGQFQNFCRMAPEDFDHLLSLTSEKIRKSSTNFRDSIPAYDKLAVTLRFLATGDSYESLMYFTKMSKSTICNAISEVCAAINEALQDYAKRWNTFVLFSFVINFILFNLLIASVQKLWCFDLDVTDHRRSFDFFYESRPPAPLALSNKSSINDTKYDDTRYLSVGLTGFPLGCKAEKD